MSGPEQVSVNVADLRTGADPMSAMPRNPLHSMEPRVVVAVDADGERRSVLRVPLRDEWTRTSLAEAEQAAHDLLRGGAGYYVWEAADGDHHWTATLEPLRPATLVRHDHTHSRTPSHEVLRHRCSTCSDVPEQGDLQEGNS